MSAQAQLTLNLIERSDAESIKQDQQTEQSFLGHFEMWHQRAINQNALGYMNSI